ncbi:sulfite exporter TauE/SafE family protein [Selenihalanaerobacter shriftii]|uniref:Probable membrane transporter protein n=1 Tax=Selenihalanaerobacter shriftii TaxID=142842 RepID=A0A1T4MWK4_9FIRM|nr:sulfite exporter TauE/SafE family protein [Selenihalanaerobacter shriftii]SJZ71028.1 hypothetical protein SAMN02745118_01606 [Selenihalanaerobacter shriftii]
MLNEITMQSFLLILGTGLAAGFINTLAGGGSFIAMTVLIFLGLPSAVANGTNRVAIMAQNLVAIGNFKRKGFFNYKLGLMLAIPATIGSIIGSKFAISLPEDIFNNILAVVMLVVLVLTLWEPQKRFEITSGDELTPVRKLIAIIVFFFVGIYGGLIQGGVGFFIIVSLSLITGTSLVKVNSIKVMIIGMYTVSSLIVFLMNGKVNWVLGIALAIGNAIGAWLGSNFAVAKGDKWIKVILTTAILFMSARLLGVFNF